MKRVVFLLMSFIVLAAVLPSCSKSIYPPDPYRGSSGYPKSIKSKPDKPKQQKSYRSVPVRTRY